MIEITEEIMYEPIPTWDGSGVQDHMPIGHKVTAVVDGAPAVRVIDLTEMLRRRGSDRLMNLPPVYDAADLYNVCDVLPQDLTSEQLDDLAVRLSNFLEDLARIHADRKSSSDDVLGALGPPMSIPIVHRAKLKAAQRVQVVARVPALEGINWPAERETMCMLYLHVPRWQESVRMIGDKVVERRVLTYDAQLGRIDEVARRYGLRCVGIGVIPE